MRKIITTLAAGTALMISAMVPAEAAIVNLSATVQSGEFFTWTSPYTLASYPGVQKAGLTSLSLGAGTYAVTPIDLSSGGTYTAARRFSAVNCTNGSSTGSSLCQQGWEHTYMIQIGSATPVQYGMGGGLGPLTDGGGPLQDGAYFTTAAGAFAAGVPTTFTLAATETVKFFWFDDNFGDNTGGISLNVMLVPLPAPLMLLGSALAALGILRRRAAT